MSINYKYWKKFNTSRNNLVKKIVEYNNKNKFNYLENEHYNHTRDILALTLVNISNKNKIIKILDFGSNLLTISNLNNKIDISKFFFTIYDPFFNKEHNVSFKINRTQYRFTNNLKKIYSIKYNLINFGSSIQYQNDFLNKIDNFNLVSTEFIVFTSTPFSLGNFYKSKQSNYPDLIQNIYSFKKLKSKLKVKKFDLIFKSRNDDKYIACKKKNYKTLSLNLIFKKNV